MSFIVQNISLVVFDVNFRSIPPLVSRATSSRSAASRWAGRRCSSCCHDPGPDHPDLAREEHEQGKAMRATAQDPEASAMMGINVNRTISFTFLLAGALAGIGAVLFLVQFNIRYDTGFELGLIAFTARCSAGSATSRAPSSARSSSG
jgi:hypothetical protein